jgi:hypothetical protein
MQAEIRVKLYAEIPHCGACVNLGSADGDAGDSVCGERWSREDKQFRLVAVEFEKVFVHPLLNVRHALLQGGDCGCRRLARIDGHIYLGIKLRAAH